LESHDIIEELYGKLSRYRQGFLQKPAAIRAIVRAGHVLKPSDKKMFDEAIKTNPLKGYSIKYIQFLRIPYDATR
jgi:hypothetical protein